MAFCSAANILTTRQSLCYNIVYGTCNRAVDCLQSATGGRKGFDGGSWCTGSEPGVHQPVSKVKTFIKYKS